MVGSWYFWLTIIGLGFAFKILLNTVISDYIVYKKRYHFNPQSFFVVNKNGISFDKNEILTSSIAKKPKTFLVAY